MICPGLARRTGCQMCDCLAVSEPRRPQRRQKVKNYHPGSIGQEDSTLPSQPWPQVAALPQGKVLQALSSIRPSPWPHCPMYRSYPPLLKVPLFLWDTLLSILPRTHSHMGCFPRAYGPFLLPSQYPLSPRASSLHFTCLPPHPPPQFLLSSIEEPSERTSLYPA